MKRKLILFIFGSIIATSLYAQTEYKTKSPGDKGNLLLLGNDKNPISTEAKMFDKAGFRVFTVNYNADTVKNEMQIVNLFKNAFLKMKAQNNIISVAASQKNTLFCALALKYLDNNLLPQNIFLINPENFDQKMPGTVLFNALPPYYCNNCRLFIASGISTDKESEYAANEYFKTWVGYDGGSAKFFKSNFDLTLDKQLGPKSDLFYEIIQFTSMPLNNPDKKINPACKSEIGYNFGRRSEKNKDLKKNKYDILFIGNSIVNNFEKPEFKPVWDRYFAGRNAINLGTSAYRTENIIYELENLDFSNQNPKLCILEIGTNNVDEANYPYRNTAAELAGGISKIINILKEKFPQTHIIVMRCLPGCYAGPNPTSHRLILDRASDILQRADFGTNVHICDVNRVFLNFDQSLKKELFSDWLHPLPVGADLWLNETEPLISEILGDQSRFRPDDNSALNPENKLENDSYDWYKRHNDVMRIKDSLNPQIVLIGNSITHFWGGVPQMYFNDGTPRNAAAPQEWNYAFADKRVLNMGFGWDRTQNMLRRLQLGEFDALNPEYVIINAGTNNTSDTQNARINTAQEIAAGVERICETVRSKSPRSKIILFAIFPREQTLDNPRRQLINATNVLLKDFAITNNLKYIDLAPQFLTADGVLSTEMMSDLTHPTPKGYKIWAQAIRDVIENY